MDININPNVLASSNSDGIIVYTPSGWSVGISKKDASDYKRDYDKPGSADNGFKEHEGEVILSHRDAKVTLSQNEANAIIDLIEDAENNLW